MKHERTSLKPKLRPACEATAFDALVAARCRHFAMPTLQRAREGANRARPDNGGSPL
jgi:hypothetical protein